MVNFRYWRLRNEQEKRWTSAGQIHPGIQARGGANSQRRTSGLSDCQGAGHTEPDIGQLGTPEQQRSTQGRRRQAGVCRANGAGPTASTTGTNHDGARHLKKSDGVLRARVAVKYAWIAMHKKLWPVTLTCEVLEVSASGY